MKTVIHKAESRGTASFGWLLSKHSFSFGHYFDPERVQFGALRVLNDDIVEPGMGFGTHPHDNMEIVSIPLTGDLEHKDSTGKTEVIKSGDVQIMSAGSGLTHSEYNHSDKEKVNFLQIWVLPKEKDIPPRYGQKTYHANDRINTLQNVVAPDNPEALWINQDSWFYLSDMEKDHSIAYELKNKYNGVYVFVLEGGIKIEKHHLNRRDAIGIYATDDFKVEAGDNSQLLLIEVPMRVN